MFNTLIDILSYIEENINSLYFNTPAQDVAIFITSSLVITILVANAYSWGKGDLWSWKLQNISVTKDEFWNHQKSALSNLSQEEKDFLDLTPNGDFFWLPRFIGKPLPYYEYLPLGLWKTTVIPIRPEYLNIAYTEELSLFRTLLDSEFDTWNMMYTLWLENIWNIAAAASRKSTAKDWNDTFGSTGFSRPNFRRFVSPDYNVINIFKSTKADEAFFIDYNFIWHNNLAIIIFFNFFFCMFLISIFKLAKVNQSKYFIKKNMKLFSQQNIFVAFLFFISCVTTGTSIFFPIRSESFDHQFGFQDPASPIAEGIIDIHNHVIFFLTLVLITVSYILYRVVSIFGIGISGNSKNALENRYSLHNLRVTHHTTLEIIWTIIPSIILYLIAVPSFLLLYSMDEIFDPSITFKAVGNQWYWTYEYSDYAIDFSKIEFDSYMLPENDLTIGDLRLLEVDNPIVLPIDTHIRIIVTASDVLHAWAVPSLGIKIDAVPGRLNQGSIFIKRLGNFTGQCSEICGVNHGFMPIVVSGVELNTYINWINSFIKN